MKCRHYKSWLMANGRIEWCFQCGAVRSMDVIAPNSVTPREPWVRPTGPNGENPAIGMDRRFMEESHPQKIQKRKLTSREAAEKAIQDSKDGKSWDGSKCDFKKGRQNER